MNKELYTFNCYDCHKTFRTDDPNKSLCPECEKFRRPHVKKRKKRSKKKTLSFAQILHIAEVYNKIHHQYLHYGDIVHLIDSNAEHCICCGATIPEGRQICPQCEKAVR